MPDTPTDATTASATPVLPAGLCILGLGHIGGSLLRATESLLPVTGWSPSDTTRDAVDEHGGEVHRTLEDALAWAVATDALVVLASPVTAFESLLRKITARAPEVLLTDVGSVKTQVARQVATIAPRTRYIGGHPMAGSELSGFSAADPDLFRGAAWVTCLAETSNPVAWDCVAGLAIAVGARVVPTTVTDHDGAVARISHLPHLLALALSQVAGSGVPLTRTLAAGSFRDGSRVAGTRAELIQAMCEANRESLIEALDDALGILGVARGTMASTGSLAKTIELGQRGFTAMTRELPVEPFELVNPTIGELLTVGADGGVITGLQRTPDARVVTGERPAG